MSQGSRDIASSASNWIPSPGGSPRRFIPTTTSASRTSATRKLPEDRIDAVIGNVPFADLKLDYQGQKLSLHDYFFAKSIDALKPGGVLALVTIAFHARQAERRHPRVPRLEGRLRRSDPPAVRCVQAGRNGRGHRHRVPAQACTGASRPTMSIPTGWASPRWRSTAQRFPINRYFLNHPEMVLGTWSRKDTLYGGEGYSVTGNGDLAEQLKAGDRPPARIRTAAGIAGRRTSQPRPSRRRRPNATSAKAASSSATTGSSTSRKAGRACPSSMAARR